MKKVVGVQHRKEGVRERLFQVIECQDCGAKTYERRSNRVAEALDRECLFCKQPELSPSHIVDGRTKHPLYRTYTAMLQRCYNENNPQYSDWGGRGISVCLRWLVDFWAFVEDMGDKPSPEYSIDRVDNDGIYHPLNCQWATKEEQQNNRRCSPQKMT